MVGHPSVQPAENPTGVVIAGRVDGTSCQAGPSGALCEMSCRRANRLLATKTGQGTVGDSDGLHVA